MTKGARSTKCIHQWRFLLEPESFYYWWFYCIFCLKFTTQIRFPPDILPPRASTKPKLELTGVVSPPSPADIKESQAHLVDYSAGAILKKHKEREREKEKYGSVSTK